MVEGRSHRREYPGSLSAQPYASFLVGKFITFVYNAVGRLTSGAWLADFMSPLFELQLVDFNNIIYNCYQCKVGYISTNTLKRESKTSLLTNIEFQVSSFFVISKYIYMYI